MRPKDDLICEALDVLSVEAYNLPDEQGCEVLNMLDRIAVLLGLVTAEDLRAQPAWCQYGPGPLL
jgi:hypothetical protein